MPWTPLPSVSFGYFMKTRDNTVRVAWTGSRKPPTRDIRIALHNSLGGSLSSSWHMNADGWISGHGDPAPNALHSTWFRLG